MKDVVLLSNDYSDMDLDLTKYYRKKLIEKGIISEEKYRSNCKELEYRLNAFITLDYFKTIKSISQHKIEAVNSFGASYLIGSLIAPSFSKKMKARMVEISLELACFKVFQIGIAKKQITKEEVVEFEKELVKLVLNYSSLWGDKSQGKAENLLKSGLKFCGNKLKQIYKCNTPINLFNLKRILGAIYQALGVYIINREFLENSQEQSIAEALYYYKVTMTKRLEDLMYLFLQ